ncbi:YadA C-terminal domain-containing protein [Providencia alcalifaciens]|uniref:YadA C-terminal domain-containing protein n=1 Tax=Providencia alcalifaciens TaxID=126385 RepID=UPI001D1680D9|nr:YadA C-terminal domain-containing protein [Providencia alcalifaciens]
MKNKLLSTAGVAILSSLSTQSFAIANNYQDAINAPYDYPEHRHEDNRNILDIENNKKFSENINKYIEIADTMTPVIDVISYAIETTSPLIKKIPELKEKKPTHYDSTAFDLPYIPNDPLSSFPLNHFSNLEGKIADHDHEIGSLNMSINNLNKKNNDQDKSNSENRAETINSIQNVKDGLSNVEKKLNDSEIKNKKYVDDAVSKNEAMATLLINDVNKLHEEDTQQLNVAIKKLDKQNTLHTRQFKQINSRFEQLESKINQTARDANAGIASVAAMTNIPYSTGTRFSAGLGVGNFKNGKAIAAGAQYQIKQNLNVRSSVSWNNSDSTVIGAGIAYGW